MTVSRARGAKAKADKLFSKIVRSRGYCEYCGESRYEKLECAHIKTRNFNNLRVEFLNAFCLCGSCHRFFHAQPDEFGAFVDGHRTPEERQWLRERARPQTTKVDWDAEVQRLTSIWKPIEAAA